MLLEDRHGSSGGGVRLLDGGAALFMVITAGGHVEMARAGEPLGEFPSGSDIEVSRSTEL